MMYRGNPRYLNCKLSHLKSGSANGAMQPNRMSASRSGFSGNMLSSGTNELRDIYGRSFHFFELSDGGAFGTL